ncbi:MAG: hypothetical protein AVDCRST_MAG02-642 [uncultured Rubrobacteraceae bacterium]|uniref:Uncharacterized protein n=1 Tax=uncultured Rubrobacteraceae bacterium TaxID=349277 RepID=A0A6J4QLL6_9ACTN|nr:MAG: hypothetical protein AVDCRST_MAG02-642 [uncultured Rubrobacteraceae bacterium]
MLLGSLSRPCEAGFALAPLRPRGVESLKDEEGGKSRGKSRQAQPLLTT